ncbi:MAG: carboxypeptidase M32 [Acidobacteria bacterium]|nr:carboxypeptidase M32 [Acidobacteriota bacterium]
MTKLEQLQESLAVVSDLNGAASVLGWDQQTYMPPGGAAARAEQLATLGRMAHEVFISDEIGELLEGASAESTGSPSDSDVSCLLCVVRRDYEKARKVPPALVAGIARAASLGMEVWVQARKDSNFALFQPAFQRILDLQQDLAQCLGFKESPYDALLDQYEPGMTKSELVQIFSELKAGLVPLVQSISERLDRVDDGVLRRTYPEADQWEESLEAARRLGYDSQRGRQDKSVHPFTTSFSVNDVRITTRVDEQFLPTALFGTLHECGHALYEQGISQNLERSPLAGGASLGVHESQSRLWENLVGRSRSFWKFFFPHVQRAFPQNLQDVSLDSFYRSINRVEPSLIRVEADEVTYNLHILLRFELESDLVEGRLALADLPEAWNAGMKASLGVVPPNDAQGVLQDVHWSNGLIGYFPTYSLGNLLSVQLFEKAQSAIPSLAAQIERGDFQSLLDWLRKNIHEHGRKFLPSQLIQRATGEPLRAVPYLRYLREKYSEIYR